MTNYLGTPDGPTATTIDSPPGLVFIGLDLSLTDTGIAVIANNSVKTYLVSSKGHDDDPYEVRCARMVKLAAGILDHIPDSEDVHVAIEGPSFASRGGQSHERAGLWWHVYSALYTRGHLVTVIPPTSLKKYATGVGNANKDVVLASVVRRYFDVDVMNNNTADAVVLAAMLARHHNYLIELSMPKTHLMGMDKVRWAE